MTIYTMTCVMIMSSLTVSCCHVTKNMSSGNMLIHPELAIDDMMACYKADTSYRPNFSYHQAFIEQQGGFCLTKTGNIIRLTRGKRMPKDAKLFEFPCFNTLLEKNILLDEGVGSALLHKSQDEKNKALRSYFFNDTLHYFMRRYYIAASFAAGAHIVPEDTYNHALLLQKVLQHDDVSLAYFLLQHGLNAHETVTIRTQDGLNHRPVIFEARTVYMAHLMTRYGADVHALDSTGNSILHAIMNRLLKSSSHKIRYSGACEPLNTFHDICVYYLACGVPINIRDGNKRHLLHLIFEDAYWFQQPSKHLYCLLHMLFQKNILLHPLDQMNKSPADHIKSAMQNMMNQTAWKLLTRASSRAFAIVEMLNEEDKRRRADNWNTFLMGWWLSRDKNKQHRTLKGSGFPVYIAPGIINMIKEYVDTPLLINRYVLNIKD